MSLPHFENVAAQNPSVIYKDQLAVKTTITRRNGPRAQVMDYLNATGFQLGLPVNFGDYPKIEQQRFAPAP